MTEEVVVRPNAGAVAAVVADDLVTTLRTRLAADGTAAVVLTGGTIARQVHAAVAAHPDRDRVDWARVELWWGDERFVPAGDAERNDRQAEEDLLRHLPVDPALVHRVEPAVPGRTVADAAASYDRLLAHRAAAPGPVFDVLMLGIGPDGHCASLFPGRPEVTSAGRAVAVTGAPKPPPERVSLTMPLLRRARQVWFVAAGEAKADAVRRSVAGGGAAAVLATPAAGPRGTERTLWFVDEAAAPR